MQAEVIEAADLAERMVAAYAEAAQRYADNDDWYSWTDERVGERWRAVVRGCRAERLNERQIRVTTPNTPDGRLWNYAASHLIDAACNAVDPDGSITFESGFIDKTGYTSFVFTWGGGTTGYQKAVAAGYEPAEVAA